MRRNILITFLLLFSLIITSDVLAVGKDINTNGVLEKVYTDSSKKPLNEAFDNTVILPFDYQGKVFLNGQKSDIYGDYKIYKKNGRVLVPLRLMGDLVAAADRDKGYWQFGWDPKKPDDVVMSNYQQHKTIKFKVNSKVMYINNQPKTIDVAPQKLDGRIVLPLRITAQALEKNIEWLDGLMVISNDLIDLKSKQTLKITDKIKTRLADTRKPNYDNRVTLVTKYCDTIYYSKIKFVGNNSIHELYKKTGKQKEIKIDLPGEENFNHSKVINNELYYVSVNNGKSELYKFNLANNKPKKVAALGQWYPEDGWVGDMKYINNDFYIILHSGDLTMGSESLYKIENAQLKEITHAKSFMNYEIAGEYLYFTDFGMFNIYDNFNRVNLNTLKTEKVGEKGYAYGVSRAIGEESISYSGVASIFIKDDYIFSLGYKESDQKDISSVYKISLDGKTQKKLTFPAKNFWLVDNVIYYIDHGIGYLVSVDLQGNNKKTLISKNITNCMFWNGNIYYSAANSKDTSAKYGQLYKYNIDSGKETQLSDISVSEFYVGKAGVYYKSEGYDLGLYKLDAKGKSISLVNDLIDTALLTDDGIAYTLRYAEGAYGVK